MKRPFDASCRSLAIIASVIGVRANAMATPVAELEPLGGLRRQHEREERVVARLGGDAAVVAVGLELSGLRGDAVEAPSEHPVDLHRALS